MQKIKKIGLQLPRKREMRISTYPEPDMLKVLPLITDFVVSNIALAYSTRMTKRNHTRGPAIVLGLLVLVAFTVFLLQLRQVRNS